MSLSTGLPANQIWKDQFSWLLPFYAGIGMIAYGMYLCYFIAGPVGLVALVMPLALLRLSQHQYIQRTKSALDELKEKNVRLEKSSLEISELNQELLETLSVVVDLRDPYVLGHSRQVTRYAVQLARKMGLDDHRVEMIHKSGLVHDIGKLGISENILLKPGKLSKNEYDIVKEHVNLSAEILNTSKSLSTLIPYVRHHHERYDGSGYPDHLKGEEIPLEARILSVADAVEAMASDRPYRRAHNLKQIIDELQKNAGTQFDPTVVQAFIQLARSQGDKLIVNSAIGKNHHNNKEIELAYNIDTQPVGKQEVSEELTPEYTSAVIPKSLHSS